MPTRKEPRPASDTPVSIRDRVKELRRVRPADLIANEKNWRTHPYAQRQALAESLDQVGIADVLLAYESPRHDGALTLIDGHARAEENPDLEWPTVILDVTDEEADQLLLTLDPMTGMAEADSAALSDLVNEFMPGTPGLEDLARNLRIQAAGTPEEIAAALGEAAAAAGPPEMELQAFEHYDYVVLLYRDALDWSRAKHLLDIGEAAFTLRDGFTRKVGLGRVVDGRRLFDLVDAKRSETSPDEKPPRKRKPPTPKKPAEPTLVETAPE
jgi:hypothetical protein